MIREYLSHFEYTNVAVAGQLLFMAVFAGVLFRVFRKGASTEFNKASNLPFEEGNVQ